MTADPQQAGLQVASDATGALGRGELDRVVELADAAAAAFVAEQGEPNFDAPLGRHDEAERELRRTAADFAARYGPDHVEVAIAQTALGAALHRVGRLGEADAAYRAGLAGRERTQGAEHPMLAPTLLNLSALCEQRGDPAQARVFAQRAVDVLEGAVTDDHPHGIAAHARLAELDAAGR